MYRFKVTSNSPDLIMECDMRVMTPVFLSFSCRRITSRAFVETEAPTKGMTRPLKPIPLFEQGPNESDCKFLKRVEKMTKVRDGYARHSQTC